jgi:beta-glucosidase
MNWKNNARWLGVVIWMAWSLGWGQPGAYAASGSHSAVVPMPRTDQGWKDRAAMLNDRVKQMPGAQLLFIGDSITQGWEGGGKEVWTRYYGARQAINLGIGGDRTQHVLWRLENGNLEGIQPKAAVIMIGTNNSNGEDNTPGQIADGVRAIVLRLREQLPQMKILLLGIFPRGENFNPQRGKILQVNQVLQKLDDGRQIIFLDIGHRFLTSEGLIPGELMPDYLHLTPKAYGIWAQAIESILARWLGDEPVQAEAGAGDPTGEWIWKIRGPNGEDIEAPLVLKAEGGRLTGRFARGEGRWLEITEGKLVGNQLTFEVRRDRPEGGEMTYRLTATLEANSLAGTAETEMDGSTTKVPWSARRR